MVPSFVVTNMQFAESFRLVNPCGCPRLWDALEVGEMEQSPVNNLLQYSIWLLSVWQIEVQRYTGINIRN